MHNHRPDTDRKNHRPKNSLKIAILLTAAIFVAEVAGGLLSGSLSLLGDALHMFQDVFALLLSLGAMLVAERLPTPSRTFGYHRVEIGAAVVNGLFLILVSLLIISQALARFSDPRPVNGPVMLGIALAGLIANIAALYVLHGSHDLNIKGAFLHVMGDTLSSVAVIAAAIWIVLTGQSFADPLLGLLIAGVIILSSFSLLREASGILLQFAPRDVDTDEVIREMESVTGVDSVHNVHLWSLCSNINVLDAHVYSCETDVRKLECIKGEIKERLEKFRIRHSTLEFECLECGDCCAIRALQD
jgi:cobalt-zinc-cadmium efflux system protein